MGKMLIRATALLVFAGLTLSAQPHPGKAFGNQNAPIRIEVFSDFQCPACKGLHEGAVQQLERDYVRTGKVYLIYRDFPLPMHRYSRQAAALASAAAELNRYEQVATALFRQQATWSTTGGVEAVVASTLSPAEMQKVKSLAVNGKVQQWIEQDIALGRQNNLTQTPTMIITKGIRRFPVAGNINYEILKRFLDELLKR